MNRILVLALVGLASGASAQQACDPAKKPCVAAHTDCTAQHPCASTTEVVTGRTTVTRATATGAVTAALPADQPSSGNPAGEFTVLTPGPEALSIEQTAKSYFDGIARYDAMKQPEDQPFNPKNLLRDRDGLSPSEAKEVLAVARDYAASRGNSAAIEKQKARKVSACRALQKAGSPDAQLAVLEAADAEDTQIDAQTGAALLAKLTPSTRTHLRAVLVEHRKSITVGRQNWKKVRETQPEALEQYRASKCANNL